MAKWILRVLIVGIAVAIGYIQIGAGIMGILIGLGAGIIIILMEVGFQRIPLDTIVTACIGIVLGLVLARLLGFLVSTIPAPKIVQGYEEYSVMVATLLAYLGMMLAIRKRTELELLDKNIPLDVRKRGRPGVKVVDTSALIDGRISDVAMCGFLEGTLLVPKFVMNELHTLSDSQDSAKRARGRRGMEILKKIQDDKKIAVRIVDKDYAEIEGVDDKIIKLAVDTKTSVITLDYNLNKLASIQNVPVLNVNELASALKPSVLPGEEIDLFVLKEGKEADQGVGYLDDGTMVVVEDGKGQIGHRIAVVVTSVLQKDSGRMVFGRTANRR